MSLDALLKQGRPEALIVGMVAVSVILFWVAHRLRD